MGDLLLPGQPVPLPANSPAPQIGNGIYERDGCLRASLVGKPRRDGPVGSFSPLYPGKNLTISRIRPHPPAPQSVVLGVITRLSPLQAMLSITVVDGVPLPPGEEFTGVIRTQDIRATDKDRVKIGDCFRGGDVVRGVVVGKQHEQRMTPDERFVDFTGDARSYFVTTARNDLGVIFATSEAGGTMSPVSWQEMRCSKTGRREKRKCAKPE